MAERLLELGWFVTCISRSQTDLSSDRIHTLILDVVDPTFASIIGTMAAGARPVDVVVYAAGIGEPLDLGRLDFDRRTFQVNTLGALDAFAAVLPYWQKSRRGHFVILSSLADEMLGPEAPSYNASKAALSMYFESMALALRGSGITATNIRFGFVDTKMAKAPWRPFMLRRSEAVDVVLRAMRTRPIRVSRPLPMAVAVRVASWLLRLEVLMADLNLIRRTREKLRPK